MKRNWNNKFTTVIYQLVVVLMITSCSNNRKQAEPEVTYTCPMHLSVVSDKAGTCPLCGMNLVLRTHLNEDIKVTEELASLIKSPNKEVASSIKTIKGEFKSLPVVLEAQGIVTYDTRNIYTIPARIGGRLEKVYLKYAFQNVRKGQKVVDIYSPELVTAQRELLYLVEHDTGNTSLIESAKNKLYLLGATQNQVEELIRSKNVFYSFSIYSPNNGYVIKVDQQAPFMTTSTSSSAMSGGMGGGASTSLPSSNTINTSSSELVREGIYVSTGQALFKVVDPSALRVELNLSVSQADLVVLNDEVDLDLGNQKMVKGKIDFVQPFFTEGQEFVKARLYVQNNDELKIGQLVRAIIRMKPVEALWVPKEAVLDLGLDKVVFVKDGDVFKPTPVSIGIQTDGWLAIDHGLVSSDDIAFNAQYLVDSESFIKMK